MDNSSEKEILIFVGDFIKKFHQPPTLEDIALFLYTKQTRKAIRNLEKQGYLERGLIHEQKPKKKPVKKHAG